MVQLQSLLTTRNRSCLRFCNGLNPWNHPLGKQQEASFSRLSIYHLILKTIRQKERWIHSNSMAVIFILYLLEILYRLASIFPPPVGRFFLLGNYCRGPKCLQRFVVSSASGSRFACFACFVWGALSWCFACFACSLAQSMQVLEMDQTLTRQLLEETGQMLSWLLVEVCILWHGSFCLWTGSVFQCSFELSGLTTLWRLSGETPAGHSLLGEGEFSSV